MMKTSLKPAPNSGKHTQGISLVELLISMVIGLVVIGAVLPTYLTSGTGQNSNAALSQISEDATLALNLVRKQIALAGYSQPFKFNAKGFARNYTERGIAGCDSVNFDNVDTADIADLTCTGTASTSANAIAVAYEADSGNSLMDGSTPKRPRDCIGSAIPPTAATANNNDYSLAHSRLYIANGSLMCRGNGSEKAAAPPPKGGTLPGTPQPLVSNIVSMRVRYGLANRNPTTGMIIPGITRYLTATEVNVEDVTGSHWNDVKAVRVCIVVRSEQEVLDTVTPYYDCAAVENANPQPVEPTGKDRRIYRAFSTTIMVNNDLGRK